jgi:hypothetical protein
MPHLIVYLLKVNAALILFFVAYRFGLRRLTFYYLNRFFLVFGIIFSSVYPLVDLSQLFVKHEVLSRKLTVFVPDWHAVAPVIIQKAGAFDYWQIPIALFWLGVVLMGARLTVQFISLYKIYRKSLRADYKGQAFRSIQANVNPFSFWQAIYLNPAKHTDNELRAIIKHEQIHVRQWHTLDVLLAELSTVFYWFNPGVWLMKQAVKENLEFITDREILQSGVDEKSYQYSLVRVSGLRQGSAIVNNFNFLTIKKRIMMMNKKRSPKAQVTRYVVLLPLVVLLALIFTISKAELNNKAISTFVKRVLPKAIISQFSTNTATEKPQRVQTDTIIPKSKLSSTRLSNDSVASAKNTTVSTFLNTDAEDSTIIDKNRKTMTLYGNARVSNITGNVSANIIHIDSNGIIDFKKCLLMINGKLSTVEALKSLNPSMIDSITVLRGSDAIGKYGEKGKYGALELIMKPGAVIGSGIKLSTFSTTLQPATLNTGLTTNKFSTSTAPGNTFGSRPTTGQIFSTGSPVYEAVVIESYGDVKAADDGEVLKVTEISGTYLVLVKKGHYFSAYSNLKSVKVAKGDKVTKGQNIGVAGIDPVTDESDMQYELFDGMKRIIPKDGETDSKDNFTYFVDVTKPDPQQFGWVSKMFRDKGFILEFHQDLNTPDLLEISLQSKVSKASATFRINEMKTNNSLVCVEGNVKTGEVSVRSEPTAANNR